MPHVATHASGECPSGSRLVDGQILLFVANLLSGGTFSSLHVCNRAMILETERGVKSRLRGCGKELGSLPLADSAIVSVQFNSILWTTLSLRRLPISCGWPLFTPSMARALVDWSVNGGPVVNIRLRLFCPCDTPGMYYNGSMSR